MTSQEILALPAVAVDPPPVQSNNLANVPARSELCVAVAMVGEFTLGVEGAIA